MNLTPYFWDEFPCGGAADAKLRYAREPWIEQVLEPYWSSCSGQRVLEIGFGQGEDLKHFYEGGADCHGYDLSFEHLRRASAKMPEAKLEIHNATEPLYGNMDLVYSMGVIHHIKDDRAVMKNVFESLGDGGQFVAAVYSRDSYFFWHDKILYEGLYQRKLFTLGYRGLLATIENGADGKTHKPFVRVYSERSLRKLVEGAGLKIDRIWKPIDWYMVVEAHK